MTAGDDLFISYAQQDGDLAATLLDLFQSAGVACFLAEKSIVAGTEWKAKLRTAIRRAKVVVVLLTPKSSKSTWVAAEIGAAWILRKALVPALRGVAFEDFDNPIQDYQGRKIGTREELDSLVDEIAAVYGRRQTDRQQVNYADALHAEQFTAVNTWNNLLKVGESWRFDARSHKIFGEGMYRYLISELAYGVIPFRIDCRLRFLSLRPEGGINAVNAGILFGWSVPGSSRQYVSVTLSGRSIFVELVGFRGRDEYVDFQHITDEVPFALKPNFPYDFSLVINGGELVVLCNDSMLLRASIGRSIIGRVGLRPWRSSLVCERFDAYTLNQD